MTTPLNHSRRHRIVYLIDALGMGGAECLLVGFLQHLDRRRFDPVVCAMGRRDGNPVARRLADLGLAIDVLGVQRLLAADNITRVQQYLRAQRADLVHCHLEFSATLGTLAAQRLAIPAVTTFHTLDAFSPRSKAYWRHKLMRGVLRRYGKRMIAVSQCVRTHHLQRGRYDPEKLVTIHNGIDLARFDAVDPCSRAALRSALGVPLDAPVAMTLCVLREAKGVQYLIAAMPAMLKAMPELRLLIVGDGEHEGALRAAAQCHDVGQRVIFTGRRDDVPQLMTVGDVFVLPTLEDALPTVLGEAMAARMPVIASNVGGIPEMIEYGRNGLLVPPADSHALGQACLQLLGDPQRARAMGGAGRQIAEQRFDIRLQTRRTEALYEELLPPAMPVNQDLQRAHSA